MTINIEEIDIKNVDIQKTNIGNIKSTSETKNMIATLGKDWVNFNNDYEDSILDLKVKRTLKRSALRRKLKTSAILLLVFFVITINLRSDLLFRIFQVFEFVVLQILFICYLITGSNKSKLERAETGDEVRMITYEYFLESYLPIKTIDDYRCFVGEKEYNNFLFDHGSDPFKIKAKDLIDDLSKRYPVRGKYDNGYNE